MQFGEFLSLCRTVLQLSCLFILYRHALTLRKMANNNHMHFSSWLVELAPVNVNDFFCHFHCIERLNFIILTEAADDTEETSALSLTNATSSSYTSLSPVLPTSELGQGCNYSECGANEECARTVVDAVVSSFCACLSGFHRDELTKSCVKGD